MTDVPVTKSLFVAAAINAIAKSDSWESLRALDATLRRNREQPLDVNEWYFGLMEMQVERRDVRPLETAGLPRAASSGAKMLSWLVGQVGPVFEIEELALDYLKTELKPVKDLETRMTVEVRNDAYMRYSSIGEDLLGELYDEAQKNTAVQVAWNSAIGRELGQVDASVEEIVLLNPNLINLKDKLEGAEDEETARKAIRSEVSGLTKDLAKNTQELTLIQSKLKGVDLKLDALAQEAARAREAQNEAIRQQTREQALRGALAIYSLLGGDKTAVRQISAILTAYQESRAAVNAFNRAIEAQVSTGTATLALAGNWVGIALALSSAFSGDDPEAAMQEQLFEALNQISKQLQSIQRQIAGGFEYMDQRLAGLSRQMESGFAAVLTGLQENRVQVGRLKDATFGLSRNLTASTSLILEKLTYAIDQPPYETLIGFATTHSDSGKYLGPADLRPAQRAVLLLSDRSKDSLHSGETLADLGASLTNLLQSPKADSVGDWAQHINTYRSICRLLGTPVADGLAVNPAMWAFAAANCIEIGINNFAPPSALGRATVPRLIAEGKDVLYDIETLRKHMPGAYDSLDVIFEFLLDLYSAAMESVGEEVSRIHTEILANAGTPATWLGRLDEFDEERAGCEEVARNYGAPGFSVDDLSLSAKPSPVGKTFVFEAKPPVGEFAGWQEVAGLVECIPSYYNPGEWPEVSFTGGAWNSFSLENRVDAILAQRLGLGRISLEYQAQIEQMRWTHPFDELVGRPKIHYVLVLQKDGTRKGLALATMHVSDSHIQEVICFARQRGNFDPVLHIKFKTNFFATMCTFTHVAGDLGERFYSEAELTDLTTNAYVGLAQSINQELRSQLDAPDSALGAAGRMLTRVTALIRGMAEWLIPDLVASHDGLRFALRGPLSPWQSVAGSNLEKWVKSEFSDYPGLPLFDGDTVRALVAGETGKVDDSPITWPGTRLLTRMETYLNLSKTAFRTTLRQARAVGGPAYYLHPVAKMLSDLELFAHVVRPDNEAEHFNEEEHRRH